jgi:hypothetical protein
VVRYGNRVSVSNRLEIELHLFWESSLIKGRMGVGVSEPPSARIIHEVLTYFNENR